MDIEWDDCLTIDIVSRRDNIVIVDCFENWSQSQVLLFDGCGKWDRLFYPPILYSTENFKSFLRE